MKTTFLFALMALMVALEIGGVQGQVPSIPSLDQAFEDEAQVRDMIKCFRIINTCSPQQKAIRERAKVMIRNFGRCPRTVCTAEEEKRMNHAMQLLQQRYPNLYVELMAAAILSS